MSDKLHTGTKNISIRPLSSVVSSRLDYGIRMTCEVTLEFGDPMECTLWINDSSTYPVSNYFDTKKHPTLEVARKIYGIFEDSDAPIVGTITFYHEDNLYSAGINISLDTEKLVLIRQLLLSQNKAKAYCSVIYKDFLHSDLRDQTLPFTLPIHNFSVSTEINHLSHISKDEVEE